MTKIKPLQDKILLKKVESKSLPNEEILKGGIILPKEENPINYGEVIEISNQLSDIDLKIGDKVLFQDYSGKEIKIDNSQYLLISYKDISAIIEF